MSTMSELDMKLIDFNQECNSLKNRSLGESPNDRFEAEKKCLFSCQNWILWGQPTDKFDEYHLMANFLGSQNYTRSP